MSTRHMRKLLGTTGLPPPDESDSDDFLPLYAKKRGGAYAALELDSPIDHEPELESDDKNIEDEQPESSNEKKKKKRNNRKNKKGKSSNAFDIDEIEKSVREVNALLGEPKPQNKMLEQKTMDEETLLFSVQQKHLDSNNEMTRIFGPEDDEDEIRRQRQRYSKYQKNIITQRSYDFNKHGLSMSINSSEMDVTFFTFDHNKDYRNLHQIFLEAKFKSTEPFAGLAPSDYLLEVMHVEALLELADRYFQIEDVTTGSEIIERIIAYMQFVAHPCFSLSGRRCRLLYIFIENRSFHIALLKYMHLLTNRACHRTALEIAKVLLNLDPSDPLAVILVIDMLALRSREHKWLYQVVEHWNRNRDGEFMFNLQYSQAMCCYHLSNGKNKEITEEEAKNQIQKTLLKFPYVLMKLIEACNHAVPEQIQKSEFFNEFATVNTPKALRALMSLYVKFTWARWREPPVMEWLITNAKEVVEKFEKKIIDEKLVKKDIQQRAGLMPKWPEEIIRHLTIIKPMSNLIVEGAVPEVPWCSLTSNPRPPLDTINRYNYTYHRQSNVDILTALLRTMRPHYNNDTEN